MLLALRPGVKITKNGKWICLNDKRWAFTMTTDEGERLLVRHVYKIGCLAKEKGFYVPSALIRLPMLFEVKLAKSYAHYRYDPKIKHRFVISGDDVFISLAALQETTDACHISKPRA